MASLGQTDRTKVYIVRGDQEPPSADYYFTDYSSYFTDIDIRQRISKLWKFSGKANGVFDFDIEGTVSTTNGSDLISGSGTSFTVELSKGDLIELEGTLYNVRTITDDTNLQLDRAYEGTTGSTSLTKKETESFKEGNTIYILAGTDTDNALLGKFVIEKPEYVSDFVLKIRGIQSSGTSKTSPALRRLAKETTPAIQYRNFTAFNILTDSTAPKFGILRDQEDGSEILAYSGANNDRIISLELDFMNKMQAVSKVALLAEKEWYIDHGTNDTTPFDEGDTINFTDQKGSSSSVKTFFVQGDGTNGNVSEIKNDTENENITNVVTIQGHDLLGNVTSTRVYEATKVSTRVTDVMDSWLDEDIAEDDTTFSVTRNTYWEGLSDFVIKIDDEYIRVASAASTTGATELTITSRGYNGSPATNHKDGSDVIIVSESSTLNSLSTVTLTVDDNTNFTSSGSIKIGDEVIDYSSKPVSSGLGSDTFELLRFATTDVFSNKYAHGEDILVFSYDNGTISGITPSNVDTTANGTGSSIEEYGIHAATLTESNTLNKNSLDQKAQTILLNSLEPIKRIAIEPSDAYDALDTITLGDVVTVDGGDIVGLADPQEVRVMGIDIREINGFLRTILYTNDTGTTVFGFQTEDYVEQKEKKQQSQIFKPSKRFSEVTRPHANFKVNGNIIPDPEGVFATGGFQPALGTEEDPWKFAFIDNSVISTDATLNLKTTGSSIGIVQIDNASTGTNALWLDPSTQPSSPSQGFIYSDTSDGNLYHYNGTGWDNLVSGGNLWQSAGGDDIEPVSSGTDVLPNTSGTIGDLSNIWDAGYFADIEITDGANTYAWSLSTTILTLNKSGGGSYIIGSDTDNIDVIINGDLTVDGLIGAALIPDTNVSYNLGSGTERWNAVFMDTLNTNDVGNSLTPSANNTYDLGSNTAAWKDLYVDGSVFFDATDNEIVYNTTNEEFEIIANSAIRMRVGSTVDIDADVDLGASSSNNITFTGQVNSDIDPSVHGLYNLGSSSDRWNIVYTERVHFGDGASDNIRLEEAFGDLVLQIDSGSGDVYPADTNAYSLGIAGNVWKDVRSTLINGSAFCENELLTSQEKEADEIYNFIPHAVYVWSQGKLQPCFQEFDPMVQAVSTDKGRPIVMGAEPVLVTGNIEEGDYLVTSSIIGHAKKGDVDRLKPGMVIAQALESGEGESHTIKAMIRKF